jgi:hypothetical protein
VGSRGGTGSDQTAGTFNLHNTHPASAGRGRRFQMTECRDINTIASRDIKNALSGFKRKFIPIDDNNVLKVHVGILLLKNCLIFPCT